VSDDVLTPVVLNTTSFCSTFPQIDGIEISRENLIDVLETMLKGNAPSVHLVGEPGIGKTTLLAQFARRNFRNCISIFARRSSWFTYDPDFLVRDLCGQMYWLLNRVELPPQQDVTDAIMRRLVYSLKSYSFRLNTPLVLVVDGLDEIPTEQSVLRELMISKLPLGFDHIKVLTSSNTDVFPASIRQRGKVWDIPPFSIEETKAFFGNKVSEENIRKLRDVCKGRPGYLAGIARLLESGQREEDILNDLPSSMPDLFELEWRHVDAADTGLAELLALLAHDANKHSVGDLAILFQDNPSQIRKKLSTVSFIKLPTSDSDEVLFVSEPSRHFASQRLEMYRDSVNRRIVDSLLKDRDGADALKFLPSYLRQAGEHQQLLNFLSPERVARMLVSANKLGPVQQKVKLGFETALEIASYSDVLRFGIQSSAFVEYSGFTISRAEIEARMNLGLVSASIGLAQSAVLKSDRLRLLALIGRKLKERGQIIAPDIVDSIQELFDEIEWSELNRSSVTELAGDLLSVRPVLATQALEKGLSGIEDRRSYVDFTLAKLSLAFLAQEASGSDEGAATIRAGISDPHLLSMSSALAQLIRAGGSPKFLEEVEKIESVKDRLFLIRQWASTVRETDKAFEILQYALDLGIKTTELTVDALHLRELAQALSIVQDQREIQSLIRIFDTQKATIFRLGPTLEYIHLQLLLAAAESKYDKRLTAHRVVDTYLTTVEVRDLAAKTTCLARMIDSFGVVDPDGSIRSKEGIDEMARNEFEACLARLLLATADHEVIARDIIAALVRHTAGRAIDVALMLNTEIRRDNALLDLVSKLLDAPIRDIDLSVVPRLLNSFSDPDLVEKATVQVLERLAKVKTADNLVRHRSLLVSLCSKVHTFSSPAFRVRAAAAGIASIRISESTELEGMIQKLKKDMQTAWALLEDDATKLELTFSVAGQLATLEKEESERYLSLADDFRSKVNVGGQFNSRRHSLQLAVRVYAGMLLRKVDTEDDLKELTSRTMALHSKQDRAGMFTDIALRLIRHEREAEARRIVNQYLRPLIDSSPANTVLRFRMITMAAPALFLVAKPTAMELFQQLPSVWKDHAIAGTIAFIQTKSPSGEPSDDDKDRIYELTYDEISEILHLLPELSSDGTFCSAVSRISGTLRSKFGKRTFSQQQSVAFGSKLTDLINRHLPIRTRIQHDGYKIIALAEIHRLERPGLAAWAQLVQQARMIPNIADRALVLAALAQIGQDIGYDGMVELIKEARKLADSSGSLLDKINRYQVISDACKTIDKELGKQLLKEALLASSTSSEPEIEAARKEIIDSAYRISPELASECASALDDDEARRAKRDVSKEVELLDLKKRLAEKSFHEEEFNSSSLALLPQASWDLLGALNSGRVLPLEDEKIHSFIKQAAVLPFQRSFPVFAYALENLVVKHKNRAEAAKILRNVFHGVLTATTLFEILAERSSSDIRLSRDTEPCPSDSGITVEPGQHEKGIEYLRNWLDSNSSEYLWINDPYLDPQQLNQVIKLVLEARPNLEVYVVTSRSGLESARTEKPYSEAFKNAWVAASLQSAPRTRIIVASVEPGGKAPIKDRWWMTGRRGLFMGTSLNGLGERTSRIELMTPATFEELFNRLTAVVSMRQRDHDRARISYESFDL
jgi:hypothetical protein